MSNKEILTLQFGHYANFVGTHWWNIQESGFEYQAAQPSEINHDVLFREGITKKGQTTFTPRLLLVDLKGSLKSLPKEGDLYEELQDPTQLCVDWDQEVEIQKEEKVPKNKFQSDLEDLETLPEVSKKKYDPEENFKVWSDYLYTRFHPRTVNLINEYEHCNENTPFDTFTLGSILWKTDFFDNDFSDKIRNYVEECDYFQGFHMLTDCTNGFSGLSSACIEHLRDEYERKSILVFPTIPSYFSDNEYETDVQKVHSIMNDSTRVLNMALSFNSYRQFGNVFVPLCTSKDGWRQPGVPREFYHTKYDHKLPYLSSAILASALDTVSLKYRLKSENFSLMDLCADLAGNGRKAAAASVCLPFAVNSDADLIDCLDQWDGPLYQSITPRCTIGTDRVMQHLTLRGIPETRLKKPSNKAGKQKEMPAYKCNTVKEMVEFYLSCTTYATASNVTTVEKPMSVTTPFPDLFDQSIGHDGNVYSDPRLENIRPGPGKYLLPPVVGYDHHDFTRYRNPQFSMGLKLGSSKKEIGPGPKYPVDKMTRYGKASPPAYSIKSRQKPLASFQTPGPGTYAPEKAPRMKEPRPPAYSMSHRYPGFRPYNTPGPDKYEVPSTLGPKVPDKPANAAYSMSFRQKRLENEQSPGPAKYDSAKTDLYKNKAPDYSISPRVYPPIGKSQTPGPIYLPKLPQKPGYSFGLRTDTDPYVTAQDDMPCIERTKGC